MRKARRFSLHVKLPSKKVREEFLLIYELWGAQKGVDFLAKYYQVRRMKIILNGKKVSRGCLGVYMQNKARFTKRGLTRKTVLHEFYHHLVVTGNLEMPLRTEEKEANNYVREFLLKK